MHPRLSETVCIFSVNFLNSDFSEFRICILKVYLYFQSVFRGCMLLFCADVTESDPAAWRMLIRGHPGDPARARKHCTANHCLVRRICVTRKSVCNFQSTTVLARIRRRAARPRETRVPKPNEAPLLLPQPTTVVLSAISYTACTI
eukprot:COSAG05_NODE_437_length_9835_cov_3.761915_12_plen_146_part_00